MSYNIKNIIKKVLKEEKENVKQNSIITNSSDFYFYKTATGSLLLLPKSSKPKILRTVNKEELKAYYNTIQKVLEVANESVKKTCNTFYKDVPLEECCAVFIDMRYNKFVDGGVHSFEATTPDNIRKKFTSCWKATDKGKPLPFEKWFISGYYPNIGQGGECTGNPWQVDMSSPETKREDFGQKINFSIKLQMIK
jgi:hypothetical protein